MQWVIQTDAEDLVFYDTRRKTGTYIIREYILNKVIESGRTSEITGKLITPDKKWRDIEKFVIVTNENKFLIETKVYDNIRIVGVSSEELASRNKDEIYNAFLKSLEEGQLIYLKRKKK